MVSLHLVIKVGQCNPDMQPQRPLEEEEALEKWKNKWRRWVYQDVHLE